MLSEDARDPYRWRAVTMDIDSDCTGAMKYVRVTDPIDQRTWEVWCEPGEASWAAHSESPGISPERWVVHSPDGAREPIDMDSLTKAALVDRLSILLGGEETAKKVLELFEPLLLDSDGVINPDVYIPIPCR
jgi:hypothetical protein